MDACEELACTSERRFELESVARCRTGMSVFAKKMGTKTSAKR
jgi:hypothetical protein